MKHALAGVLLVALAALLWLKASLPGHDYHLSYDYSVDHAYIISLDPSLDLRTSRYLGVQSTLVTAINSSYAVQERVPLYVRHTMAHGRHDHLQIANAAMLGCYLSHVHVWETFLNTTHETIVVFEEDAVLHETSAQVLSEIWHDMRVLHSWSIVMLEAGHLNTEGSWRHLGKHLTNCSGTCTWFGTKAYMISRQGAALLLRHSRPVAVQVDALITLAAEWDPEFDMYWTRASIVGQRMVPSTVWDGCIKCYMPIAVWPYVAVLTLLALPLRDSLKRLNCI